MKKRKVGRKAFRKDPIKAAGLWQKAANEGLRPISKREQDLILAEDRGYEQAKREFETNRKLVADQASLEMLSQVGHIAEAQTRLVIQIADLVKLCKVAR